MTFAWRRFGGYEVSSKGDKRFSAFNAIMADGRSLECHYQCDVKGYQPGGRNWQLGKGKPSLTPLTPSELFEAYLGLWREWATHHPELIEELYQCARSPDHPFGIEEPNYLCDRFATTPVNQAHALSIILNERYPEG
jgi:hypothetical protein